MFNINNPYDLVQLEKGIDEALQLLSPEELLEVERKLDLIFLAKGGNSNG